MESHFEQHYYYYYYYYSNTEQNVARYVFFLFVKLCCQTSELIFLSILERLSQEPQMDIFQI